MSNAWSFNLTFEIASFEKRLIAQEPFVDRYKEVLE